MDYRFYLEELIFDNNRSLIDEQDMFKEFEEYPFKEYVSRTVEAIILPHIEVLKMIHEKNGKVQFADIWPQHFSDALKTKVRERDNFMCVVCDSEIDLHVHHKIPRKYGGVNHQDNLVTLCSSCHAAIETADIEHAFRKCMLNAIKGKTSLQKKIDTDKDIRLLKEEVLTELDGIFSKVNSKDPKLGEDVLNIIKKVEFIFEQ